MKKTNAFIYFRDNDECVGVIVYDEDEISLIEIQKEVDEYRNLIARDYVQALNYLREKYQSFNYGLLKEIDDSVDI